MTEKRPIPEWVTSAGSLVFLYAVCFWGFNRYIKEEVWERQHGKCGDEGCNKNIAEYHHRVPERALLSQGIKGRNDTAANAVGLCFDHHKNKWDKLMFKGIIYPGIPLEEVPQELYTTYRGSKKKRRR